MTGFALGRKAKFYLNTGSYGSPTWAEVPQVSDLTRNGEWDSAELNCRESALKMGAKTLADMSVGCKMKFVPGDSNIALIVSAFFSPDTVIDIMVLNGPMTTSGSYGVRYPCQVTSDNEDQGLNNGIFEDLKFMPTPTVNPPCTVAVAGSAPVFTTI